MKCSLWGMTMVPNIVYALYGSQKIFTLAIYRVILFLKTFYISYWYHKWFTFLTYRVTLLPKIVYSSYGSLTWCTHVLHIVTLHSTCKDIIHFIWILYIVVTCHIHTLTTSEDSLHLIHVTYMVYTDHIQSQFPMTLS